MKEAGAIAADIALRTTALNASLQEAKDAGLVVRIQIDQRDVSTHELPASVLCVIRTQTLKPL